MKKFSAYYINLDSATERMNHINEMWKSQNIPFTVQRFSAIKPDFTLGNLSIGETGCIFSHLSIWENSVDIDDYLIVIEDDAIICNEFYKQICRLIDSQSEDWDILFLSHTEPINDIKRIGDLLKICKEKELMTIKKNTTTLNANQWYMYGTVGYIINKKSKLKMLNSIMRFINGKVYLPIDNLINKASRENIINCKISFPYLVGVRTDLISQMNQRSNEIFDQLHCTLINLFFIDRSEADLNHWAEKKFHEQTSTLELKVISQIYSTYLNTNLKM